MKNIWILIVILVSSLPPDHQHTCTASGKAVIFTIATADAARAVSEENCTARCALGLPRLFREIRIHIWFTDVYCTFLCSSACDGRRSGYVFWDLLKPAIHHMPLQKATMMESEIEAMYP